MELIWESYHTVFMVEVVDILLWHLPQFIKNSFSCYLKQHSQNVVQEVKKKVTWINHFCNMKVLGEQSMHTDKLGFELQIRPRFKLLGFTVVTGFTSSSLTDLEDKAEGFCCCLFALVHLSHRCDKMLDRRDFWKEGHKQRGYNPSWQEVMAAGGGGSLKHTQLGNQERWMWVLSWLACFFSVFI